MRPSLFATELMLVSIATMAFVIFWDLYRARDGKLRVIMMWYMIVECILFLGTGIFFWLSEYGYTHMDIVLFSLLILPFKLLIKTILFIWVRTNQGL